jgi:hypothetical protein
VAFEAYAKWMRGKTLAPETATRIVERLLAELESSRDPNGFAKPFAALVLSEAARMDRLDAYLSPAQRERLAQSAAAYLKSVKDYRGFDEKDGWRHGVAHGADLILQVSINPHVAKPAVDRNLSAIESQIAPAGHFYVYGEPNRLASAVFWIAQRKLYDQKEWSEWLARVASPDPLANWDDAYKSQKGLAKRHNTLLFIEALYAVTQESGSAETKEALLPGLKSALQAVW